MATLWQPFKLKTKNRRLSPNQKRQWRLESVFGFTMLLTLCRPSPNNVCRISIPRNTKDIYSTLSRLSRRTATQVCPSLKTLT